MGDVTRDRALLQANQRFEDLRTRTILNDTRKGRLNNGRSGVSLSMGATQTTVSDDIVTSVSAIILQPEATLGHDYKPAIPRTTVIEGSFVIQHVSTSTSTVNFTYLVF